MTLENSIIRVLIIKDGLAKPLIASTVVMPQPEMQMMIGGWGATSVMFEINFFEN